MFSLGLLEVDDEEEPKPVPAGELVFFGGVATELVSSRFVVVFWGPEGFWDLIVSLCLVGEWRRRW